MNLYVKTKYVCGIDLHAQTMAICIMDKNGKILVKKSIKCEIRLLLEILKPYLRSITVGVESTYNWYWILDGLKRYKVPCHLGHALYIKYRCGNKHKNDPVDAHGIADLLRTNRFPLAYDYPEEMRETRDLLRRRHFFVHKRAGTYTHLQNTFNSHGFMQSFTKDVRRKGDRRTLENLPRLHDTRMNISCDFDYIESLDTIIRKLEYAILDSAHYHNRKHYKLLNTMPGAGKITSLTILYETHTTDRFKSAPCYSSYCRVVRADNESGGTSYGHTTNDKIGNPYLKWAFSEIGVKMISQSKLIGEWFEKQVMQHGKGGAMARLRHKIAIAVYYMLKHEIVFDEYKFLGIEQRRAVTPARNGTESSGKKSKPSSVTGNRPARLKKKRGRPPLSADKNKIKVPGRISLHTTGKRNRLTKRKSIAR
jgi:transposase